MSEEELIRKTTTLIDEYAIMQDVKVKLIDILVVVEIIYFNTYIVYTCVEVVSCLCLLFLMRLSSVYVAAVMPMRCVFDVGVLRSAIVVHV